MPDTAAMNDEARTRIGSARAREVAFQARRILSRGGYSDAEVSAIVEVLVSAFQGGDHIKSSDLTSSLVQNGISPPIADEISQAVFAHISAK